MQQLGNPAKNKQRKACVDLVNLYLGLPVHERWQLSSLQKTIVLNASIFLRDMPTVQKLS